MKNGQIFAHKSTARGRLDLEYLDETSGRKISLREHAAMDQQIGKKLKGFTDYASKETLGQVHVGGFFHDLIRINPDGSSTAPSRLSNEERKRRTVETWQRHLGQFASQAQRPVIAHRMIFSMSTEQHNALVAAGINPDQVLHATMKKIMRRFAETFHPGDSVGYAYGLHHDTAHLHVHVALCPRTEKGSYVGCSTSRFSQTKHKRQMDRIRSWFEQENQRWQKILSSPEKIQQTISSRLDSDRFVFAPRLNTAHLQALRSTQTTEAIRLQNLYQSIRNLEAAIAAKRQYQAAQRNVNYLSRFLSGRKPKLTRSIEKIATKVEARSLREMQALLFKIKRDYRTAHKRYTQLHGFHSYATRSTQSVAQRQTNQKF